ncbi:hypothetical protein MiAbW_03602 [Microcystis aeruginosa NIES-4325]|uniref:Uncharacterized protein n=1 Tax=Microcystis aeruginosa NIES-4325 TaxID=2569534 RepID=A0A5J4FG86_MICAE|nr:hypothetical protein MiAbW_03602 [Microcystis aeruginosa NIES-4325]
MSELLIILMTIMMMSVKIVAMMMKTVKWFTKYQQVTI